MTARAARLLVADDEPSIRKAFRALLEPEGYEVATARNGDEAVAKFRELRPDLVLLDVMMPRRNGIAACADIRAENPSVPIIFFTAAPSEATLVRGLGLGADDYIAKDRPPSEFLARISAALRRAERSAPRGDVLELSGTTVDFAAMSVESGGRREALTRSESIVLRLLSGERGRFFSYDEIFAALGGDGYTGTESSVRSLVSRLKAKLGRAGALIGSVRGGGYRMLR